MIKILLGLLFSICIIAWRADDIMAMIKTVNPDFYAALSSGQKNPSNLASPKINAMSNEQLIELMKTNPKAFDDYVKSHINAPQTRQDVPASVVDDVEHKQITVGELAAAAKKEPREVSNLLNSENQAQHSQIDKLMNFLTHGKFE